MSDIRYLSGKENVVADTMLRIDAVHMPQITNFELLAESQSKDAELKAFLN